MNRALHLAAVALATACSEIERPEFGAEFYPSGAPAGEIGVEPAYEAAVAVDVSIGPGGGPPVSINPGIFGAAAEAGGLGLNADDEVKRWVSYTGLPILKWGGTGAESFDWEADFYRGLMFRAGDGRFPWPPQMGIMEFLEMCEDAGTEPVVVISAQLSDPPKAARLVSFLNSPDTTQGMGKARADLGRRRPYGVTLFQIGDDPEGRLPRNAGTRCHFGKPFLEWRPCAPDGDAAFIDGPAYAELVRQHADLMRRTSGGEEIRIIASGFADDIAALEKAFPGTVDFFDASYYPFTGAGADRSWGTEDDVLDSARGMGMLWDGSPAESFAARALAQMAPFSGTDVKLSVGEWNMDAEGRMAIMGKFPEALWAAEVMGQMAAAGTGLGAFWTIESGDLLTPTPQAGDFGFLLYEHSTGRRVRKAVRVSLQLFALFFFGEYVHSAPSDPRLLMHAAFEPEYGAVTLIVTNRDQEKRAEISLQFAGGTPRAAFNKAWSVEEDAPGKPTGTTGPRSDRAWCAPDLSRCSLPPHSVTAILGNR
ncbi:MAG: hypothetical protein HY897_09140 [Deltaproteobacteria bacterium]|nr:hypothetical protein [Deltaproteobacteria bacterium]